MFPGRSGRPRSGLAGSADSLVMAARGLSRSTAVFRLSAGTEGQGAEQRNSDAWLAPWPEAETLLRRASAYVRHRQGPDGALDEHLSPKEDPDEEHDQHRRRQSPPDAPFAIDVVLARRLEALVQEQNRVLVKSRYHVFVGAALVAANEDRAAPISWPRSDDHPCSSLSSLRTEPLDDGTRARGSAEGGPTCAVASA